MRNMKIYLVMLIIMLAAFIFASPAIAAVFEDKEAGFTIEYDDTQWFVEDVIDMFGDPSEFDPDIVSKPFVITNYEEEVAAVIVVVSGRDDYDKDVLGFIEHSMGAVVKSDIYETDDVFTDASGDEYESKVRVWGVAPEFEDEGVLLSQIFMAGDKRYEICFLALPGNFISAWETAKGIMDSIDIK